LELREAILNVLGMKEENNDKQKLITRHSLRESRRSLRVLLAEDNAINRELSMRLLTKRGHTVVVAENGKQAVQAVEQQDFDVVLMDVQMPEMDGFEATGLIRQKEKETGRHLPIVAMTAHAMKGDRERCLAAGMDAYVSKPVQFEELLEVTEAASESVTSDSANQVLNLEVTLTRVGGDEVLLADLARIFCAESHKLLGAVDDAIARRSPGDLRRAAHTLKGSIATFVAQEATETAEKLEDLARLEDLDGAQETYQLLRSRVEKLRGALENIGDSRSQPAEAVPAPANATS
jgi:CheY-like chemotaxis protein